MPVLIRRSAGTRPTGSRATHACTPDVAVAEVLAHREGPLRVIGGPGTGKTTLATRWVAELLRRGAEPEQVLVLTASRRAAGDLRERIVGLLAEPASDSSVQMLEPASDSSVQMLEPASDSSVRTMREPMVRTVHSYAFGLLRLRSSRLQLPPPRLLSGPEQDVMIRELLVGDAETGGHGWPAGIRPALTMPAFAAELRDLLMRSAERGLGPESLVALGRAHGREEWIAAGRFYERYEQVTLLRGSVGTEVPEASAPALDAAELVSEALLVLETDHETLLREQNRLRHIVVDDAQHLDPQQARLIRLVAERAGSLLILGDPDQTVYTFRGADPELLSDPTMPVTRLAANHRSSAAVRAAVSRLRARLPRTSSHPTDTVACGCLDGAGEGELTVRVFRSAAQEASWVADRLRRAHLQGGVPWSDMAVVVRSTSRSLPVLRRALLGAGVPAAAPTDSLPVARQGAVVPLLTLLQCAMRPADLADEDTAASLLTSPLGGADPLTLRRLRRELRRVDQASGRARPSAELLAEVLDPTGDGVAVLDLVDESAAEPARRLARLLELAATAAQSGETAESVLWTVWNASGLAKRWSAAVRRGGPIGAQADRDLDAVVGLFDAAARYADRLPGADGGVTGVLGFCSYVSDQQIVGDSLAPRSPQGESVAVLTAHASAGREWTVVAVPGVQEGSWPDLRLRGSLLGVEQLVDEVSGWGASQSLSRSAPVLAEERRLLLLAASRARDTLLVSAVHQEDEQPSRFLDELDGSDTDPDGTQRVTSAPGRALTLSAVVAQLRRVVVDPAQDQGRRAAAAAGLAKMAEAGVPGAHPDTWYGLVEPSTDRALRVAGRPVAVSPSMVELVASCPLRWMLSRHGGDDASQLPAVTGILVHGLLQAAAAGATEDQLEQALGTAWTSVDAGAPWFSRAEQDRVRAMMTAFRGWLERSRGVLTQVALERDVAVRLPGGGEDDPDLVLRGRVDRLEHDGAGRPVVIDIKSGKTPIPKRAVAEHAQLATYQLAAARGAFVEDGLPAESGGAAIVQVTRSAGGAAAELLQPPLDEAGLEHWLAVVQEVARRAGAARFPAVESADCERCPSRTACPLHDAGRQVTQ